MAKKYDLREYKVHSNFAVIHVYNYETGTLLCGQKTNVYGSFSISDFFLEEHEDSCDIGCKKCKERFEKLVKKGKLIAA